MVMEATHSAQSVGREFVRQYYTLLNQAPDHLHRFYNHNSSFIHGGLNNTDRDILPAIGQKEIHEKIKKLNFRDCHTRISQVDSQPTLDDGVVIQVTGEFSNAGEPMRRFTQTFVLASRAPKMYYVINDIFRYQDLGFPDEEDDHEPENTLVETVERTETEEGRSETEEEDQGHQNQTQTVPDAGHTAHISGQQAPLQQPQQPMYYPPTSQVHPMQPIINGNIHEETPLINQQQRQPIIPQPAQQSQQYIEATQPEQFTVEQEVPIKVEQQQQQPSQAPLLQHQQQQPPPTTQPPQPQMQQSSPQAPTQSPVSQPLQQPPATVSQSQSPPQTQPPQQPISQPPLPPSEEENRVQPETNDQQTPENTQQPPPETESEQITSAGSSNRPKSYAKTVRSSTTGACTFMPKTSMSPPPVSHIRNEERSIDIWNPTNTNMNSNTLSSGPQHRVGNNQQRSRVGPVQKDNRLRRDWPDNHQLFVGNVPHHATEPELRLIFEKFGRVVDLRIFSKGNERSKGPQGQSNLMRVPHYGFVTFDDASVVAKVLQACPICYPGESGQKLNIEEKKNKPRVPGDNNMRSNQDNMRSSIGVQQQQPQRGSGGPGVMRGGQHARGGRGFSRDGGRGTIRQPGNMGNPGYQNRR